MKPKYGALCIGLILAAVATILLIALPGSANLYAAYIFCLIGITMMVAGVWETDDNAPASYAQLGQVGWFLPVSLFISVVVLALQGVGVFTLPLLWYCIVQIIPMAFAGIQIVAVFIGKREIERVDTHVKDQRNKFTGIVNTTTILQQKINTFPEEQRIVATKALKRVIDGLRYSDPVSTPTVHSLDSKIESGVFMLNSSCTIESITHFVSECDDLYILIQERSNTLKLSKS